MVSNGRHFKKFCTDLASWNSPPLNATADEQNDSWWTQLVEIYLQTFIQSAWNTEVKGTQGPLQNFFGSENVFFNILIPSILISWRLPAVSYDSQWSLSHVWFSKGVCHYSTAPLWTILLYMMVLRNILNASHQTFLYFSFPLFNIWTMSCKVKAV